MRTPPIAPSPADKGRQIWERLRANDPTAPSDLAATYLDKLADWLARKYPRADPHDCLTAAEEALLTLSKRPETFQPERGSLDNYLYLSAAGDLKNLVRRERRRRERQVSLDTVELSPELRKYLRDEMGDPAQEVERREMEAANAERVRQQLQLVRADGGEKKILDLIGKGERRTAVYAQALGLDHLPLVEQCREVKRVKDRLKKRLARSGRQR